MGFWIIGPVFTFLVRIVVGLSATKLRDTGLPSFLFLNLSGGRIPDEAIFVPCASPSGRGTFLKVG